MATPRSITQASGSASDEVASRAQVAADLMSDGKLPEARVELELALAGQPKNQRLQSMLALACFKLGALERASELYQLLVRENPVEPTLRVNLGLVYLKLGSVGDAVRELQTSVDLAPEHKKAQNYLGLALAQAGDLEAARAAFVAAGSTSMVEKMNAALAERAALAPPEPAALPSLAEQAFVEIEGEDEGVTELPPLPTPTDPLPLATVTSMPPPVPRPVSSGNGPLPATLSVDSAPHGLGGAVPGAFLSDLAQALRLAPAQTTLFQVNQNMVGIRVQGEILTRLQNLVAVAGQVTFAPEMKRFRGRATDKPFGVGSRRFVRATGQGLIWAGTHDRLLLPLDLGESSAYFAEEAVFAFEEALTFENGRLPGKNVPDVNLIHLRGRGKVLLSLSGPLRSVEVSASSPCAVAVDHLVGWLGSLTPRIVFTMAEADGESARIAVELAGEGFAFLALPTPK
jgi:tetratricopeptide (TPR) repeat protein